MITNLKMALFTSFLSLVALVSLVGASVNYCGPSLCPPGTKHVACRFPLLSWGDQCFMANRTLSTVTDADIQIILQLHNDIRRRVARGTETRGSPGPQPPASDMRQLTWNQDLANLAQTLAQQCVFQHDECRTPTEGGSAGQNLYIKFNYTPFVSRDWESAISAPQSSWYSEVDFVGPQDVQRFTSVNGAGGNVIGHYTQLVWANTAQVGCGISFFRERNGFYAQFIVCNYSPAGNFIGLPIYRIGITGTACPSGTQNNNDLCALITA